MRLSVRTALLVVSLTAVCVAGAGLAAAKPPDGDRSTADAQRPAPAAESQTRPRSAPSAAAGKRAELADELVLAMLDHEALYTLVGGLKPMSTGIWRAGIDLRDPDLSEVERVRDALRTLRNETFYADVMAYAQTYDGTRYVDAWIVHRESLAAMIDRYSAFWAPFGISASTHPAAVVAIVDRMPRLDRFRGYGYLFGYPRHAVDFFVAAAASEDETGTFVEREFLNIPTFSADTGQFVYAVPVGHEPTPADQRLTAGAAEILADYRERRAAGIGPDGRGARELLRRWLAQRQR
jgi:hypothetical protein